MCVEKTFWIIVIPFWDNYVRTNDKYYTLFFGAWKYDADSKLKQAAPSTFDAYYPFIVLAVDISFINNKSFHCMHLKFFNCNVQGSPLWWRD